MIKINAHATSAIITLNCENYENSQGYGEAAHFISGKTEKKKGKRWTECSQPVLTAATSSSRGRQSSMVTKPADSGDLSGVEMKFPRAVHTLEA